MSKYHIVGNHMSQLIYTTFLPALGASLHVCSHSRVAACVVSFSKTFYLLVQPKKTGNCHDMTKFFLLGHKASITKVHVKFKDF